MADINRDIDDARQTIRKFVKETSSLGTKKTCWDVLSTYAALLDYYERLRMISEEVSDYDLDEDDIADYENSVKKIIQGINRLIVE